MNTTVEGAEQLVHEERALNKADRCDRCGAGAMVRVSFVTGAPLLFCGHHFKAHADKLKAVALYIHSEITQ